MVENKWIKSYNLAKEYFSMYGNLDVSYYFKYKDFNLGMWISRQRKKYSENNLSREKIELLKKIDFIFINPNSNDLIWDKMYKCLKEYYEKYRHLYIPITYITENGENLGRWVNTQRQNYKKGILSKERLDKLNDLDRTWQEKTICSTSFPEQAILFYIQKIFPNATKYKSKDISEIDIFIPELRVGIEYDGFHHKDISKDIYKTKKCLENNIKLIRVREKKCPEINDGSYIIKLVDTKYKTLEEAIQKIFSFIKIRSPIIDLKRDSTEILDTYIKGIDLYWYQMYDELKEYHKEYGNINVPLDYITTSGKKLGIWINTQRDGWKKRGRLRTLTTQKVNLLNQLGMDWTPLETQWNEMYKLAKEYFDENGDLLVNINYEIDGIALGQWISTQRQNKRNNKLSKERINKLEIIGMVWSPMQSSWEEYYKLAKIYYKENNNLDIPNDYIYDNKNLGMWISSQRQKYKNKKISEDRIRLLNILKMDWVGKDNEAIWNDMYLLAKDYFEKYGNLKVPPNYQVNNKNLGNWIRNQRSNYTSNSLSEEQIIKLNAIGMVWNSIVDQWEKMYSYAKNYYTEYGNLEIPNKYITEDGIPLGIWIATQRDKYKNERYKISPKQIDLLERIGMIWDVAEKNWLNNYKLAKKFYDKNNNLLIPDTYIIDGVAIGRWIGTQRKNYKNHILSDDKIKLLNNIKMIWDVNIEKWQNMYLYALKFYKEHNNLNMPDKYKMDGHDIFNWIVKQREKYKKGILSKEQVLLLEKIGMNWNPNDNLWEQMYNLAKQYFLDNGNLMIPIRYEINNIKLGDWILSQRQLFKNNKLSKDRIDKLNMIQMVWNPFEDQWEKMYELAKEYYEEYKNLEIPQRYISKNDEKLGAWISNLRQNKNKLSSTRIKQLDNIGMKWKIKFDWDDFYELAVEYYNEYDNVNLKCREEYKGIKLGWWLTNQKRYKKDNKLSKEKIDKLNKIGLF